MKKRKISRLLKDLRFIWYEKTFTVLRARRTWDLLFRFVTGKVFLLTILAAAVAAPPAYDLLAPPTQVPTGPPAPDIEILVVSIAPSICPPCRRLIPVIDDLKSEGYNLMTVGSIPRIRDFPTILIYRDKKLVDIIIGFVDEKTLKERIHAQSTPK